MPSGRTAAWLVVCGLVAACTGRTEEPAPPTSAASAASTTPAAPTEPAPPVEPVRVVVTHATAPALDLDAETAGRIVGGDLTRWRGRAVVHDVAPPDPRTLGVLPLDRVDASMTVARVDGVDPVRDDPRAVHLAVVGDLMLTRGVPDPAAALAPMRRRLAAADLTVGNLESTLSTDGPPQQGGDSFGATPALLGVLADAGFDALSLANNHTGDYGPGALLRTLAAFDGSPVARFGAGRDVADAGRPAYLSAGGVRFAFVGFNAIGETPRATAGEPGALSVRMPPRTGPLVRADLDRVVRIVRRTVGRADVVVVLPHWGTQYTHAPEPVQRRVGRALARAGADLVVGGHPHWVQGVDWVSGVPVLHSLGNFVFDMDFMAQTLEGVLLEATFWGDRLKAVRLVPYRMDPSTFAPRMLRGAAGRSVLADVWSTSTGPFAR